MSTEAGQLRQHARAGVRRPQEDALLTPRLALDRLSAGTPPLDDEIWRLLQMMFNERT